MKTIYFIIVALIALCYVFSEVRKNKFSIKESFYWMMAAVLMLILAIFPKIIDKFAVLIGIDYPPSLLFVICIIFLLFINFRSSRKLAIHNEKIIELAQRIAILENEIESNKKKK